MVLRLLSASWHDAAGIVASLGCAVHCAAMPLLIGYLPALGLSWLADESFHVWMALACFVLALAAFVPGWRRHRRWKPGALGIAGVTLLAVAAFGLTDSCCDPSAVQGEPVASCCPHCQPEVTPEQTSQASWVEPIVPWLTPLGGLFLVAGHLMNRRSSCRCCPK